MSLLFFFSIILTLFASAAVTAKCDRGRQCGAAVAIAMAMMSHTPVWVKTENFRETVTFISNSIMLKSEGCPVAFCLLFIIILFFHIIR